MSCRKCKCDSCCNKYNAYDDCEKQCRIDNFLKLCNSSIKKDDYECVKKCGLIYLIGTWFDNQNGTLVGINYVPKNKQQISWTVQSGIINIPNPQSPTNGWNMQGPQNQQQFQFPIFPLKVCDGDKIEFIVDGAVNAIAVAINVDGVVYRTFNSTKKCANDRIVLKPECGSVVDPNYEPVADIETFAKTENFVSIKTNNTPCTNKLTWCVQL